MIQLMYKEYQPDARLAPFIETYWIAERTVGTEITERILPDGCVDIIFNFRTIDEEQTQQQGIPHIVGTMTSFLDITYSIGEVQMLGIRFRPTGITAFIQAPVYEFTDRNIDLRMVDSLFDQSFYKYLPERPTIKEKIEYIDNYFIRKLSDILTPDPRIVYAVNIITNTKGQISINEISKYIYLSQRQFERRFKYAVGISPKTFSRIIKFRNTIEYIKTNRDESLFSIAVDCGYYDHSHLTKEMKQLGGKLPNQT